MHRDLPMATNMKLNQSNASNCIHFANTGHTLTSIFKKLFSKVEPSINAVTPKYTHFSVLQWWVILSYCFQSSNRGPQSMIQRTAGGGPLHPFSRSLRSKLFHNNTKILHCVLHSFSHECTVKYSRGYVWYYDRNRYAIPAVFPKTRH